MDVGDGLTLAKKDVNGKTSSVILFTTHGDSKTKSKTRKDGTSTLTSEIKKPKKFASSRPVGKFKTVAPRNQPPKNKDNVENKSPSIICSSKAQKNQPQKNKDNGENRTASALSVTNTQNNSDKHSNKSIDGVDRSIKQDKTSVNSSIQDNMPVTSGKTEVESNYVTLTHDQLNSILNLVQANLIKEHPVESTNFLSAISKDTLQVGEGTVSQKVEKVTSAEKVAVDTKSSLPNIEIEHVKENEENPDKENAPISSQGTRMKIGTVADEKHKVNPGAILGFGTRDQQRSMLATSKQKWLEELNEQVKNNREKSMNKKDDSSEKEKTKNTTTPSKHIQLGNQSLPAAMRSSFFLGEFTPRDHAYSAKKRTEQERWKKELDQQLDAKNKAETENRKISPSSSADHSDWTKHFDTLSMASNMHRKQTEHDLTHHTGETVESSQPHLQPPVVKQESSLSTKEDPSERLSYLRTMTSLLDPAEIEAMELRRIKQEEHRRAIAQQVAEKRKLKEDEKKIQKHTEEMEEKRLAEDRLKLQEQYEQEKHHQLLKEEKREQQTRKLYQQIQEAEAFALRDKMERRKHILHDNGHDTSRLEKTHNSILANKSIPVPEQLQVKAKQPSLASAELSEPNVESQALSLTTNAADGKIKLEISLSQSSGNFKLAEAGVQTENDDYSSYHATEVKNKKFTSSPAFERKYTEKTIDESVSAEPTQGQIEKTKKPKWGVGHQKKHYIPASQRYSSGEKWKKLHQQRMKAREKELLNQQVLNQPNKRFNDKSKRPGNNTDQETSTSQFKANIQKGQRVASALSVTTDQAKYEASRHSSSSPVPDTFAFVEYRRSDSVLDPNEQKDDNVPKSSSNNTLQGYDLTKSFLSSENKDPLLDGNVKQRERHDRILHEISILRQGLLLKQREVASYPVNIGKITSSNLPERQNESPVA